ncbi:mannose-6-phosphate isomerase [Roseovarius halotolerans]|uniref:Cellobiose 2-epimerase n=1 Tax=Roseovarius halotolerans TaxID=505353 RepID=A0A1X6Z4J6_9RHOB|nr:AGE family epimerase/isomerase [Roseovarius halotolerans]RKT32206.1 mannose-6-phosphate isomerase [Roseovarius halotolerans]SLN40531.1 Cellobiose 2-epimerase [Roseovarius halotolerans]
MLISGVAANYIQWLEEAAYPLWSGRGVDPATGIVWEALDHAGKPLFDSDRRLRVLARQAYCFVGSGRPTLVELGERQFRYAMDHGFCAQSGRLAAVFDSHLNIRHAPHDLYDLAFMLLAASTLLAQGRLRADDLPRLEAALGVLKAGCGWFETMDQALPRRQNPHMHLFEAATELYHITGAPRFLGIAEECHDLFSTLFLQKDGRILEHYDAGLQPLTGARQSVEPGHMAEWIYLLHRYQQVTGRSPGSVPERLFAAVQRHRTESGFLPDRADPRVATRRLWPQLEYLRAAAVMRQRGHTLDLRDTPEQIMSRIARDYLDKAVPGGWFDRCDARGKVISSVMPASSLYHLQPAIRILAEGP